MGMFIMLKQRITLLRINELVLIGYFIAATVMWVWILSDWSEEGVRSRSGNVSRHGAWGGEHGKLTSDRERLLWILVSSNVGLYENGFLGA